MEMQPNALAFTDTVTHTFTQEDKQFHQSTTMTTQDESPGFLQVLLPFLGSPENQKIETRSDISLSQSTSSTQQVSVSVSLHAQANDHYAVRILFDTVFGTAAFEDVPVGTTRVLEGHVRSASGQPLKGNVVTLQVGNTKFATTTNDQGTYAFSAAGIPSGNATVRAAGVQRSIIIAANAPAQVVDILSSTP